MSHLLRRLRQERCDIARSKGWAESLVGGDWSTVPQSGEVGRDGWEPVGLCREFRY